jgi:hypothetical protein
MPLPDIQFQKGQGGLGRPLPGQDFISALVLYTASLPSGFTSTNRIKALFALSDAVSVGILNDYSDATAASATYLITAAGATGDVIKIAVNDLSAIGASQQTVLCAYTKLSSDSSIALLGASIAAAINAGTLTHGYTASFNTATLTITAPKSFGVYLNSGSPLVVTITGTIAGTITQFTGGIASKLALWYYQIAEFFRLQPQGVLYVGFFAVPGSYAFTEITTVQNFATGTVRQIAIWKDNASAFASGDLSLIDGVCKANDAVHKPISALYSADLSATTDISTVTDLSTLSANKSTAVIAMDGGGQGWFLWLTTGKSVPAIGAALGTVALSKVSESIAWVGKFNISNGAEDEVLAFANGQLFSSSAITDNLLGTLSDRRYVFLRKFVGLSGSYWNDSQCAIASTSDYSQIENNRTIDKATRGIYSSLLPSLNSPIQLNADGTISETTTAYLESQAGVNLDQMVRDSELSAYDVTINPSQNVLATSKIIVVVELVINGVARTIQIPIGFVPKIS